METYCGQEQILVSCISSSQKFLPCHRQNLIICAKSNLSSAFDIYIELSHSHTMTPFDTPGKQPFIKHYGKRRNCS